MKRMISSPVEKWVKDINPNKAYNLNNTLSHTPKPIQINTQPGIDSTSPPVSRDLSQTALPPEEAWGNKVPCPILPGAC